jgi:hypothetical protein
MADGLVADDDGHYRPTIRMEEISNQDPKALRDLEIIEKVLTKEYEKKMLPEAAALKAKQEIDEVYAWAAYNRTEANRETQGFGVGPNPVPGTGAPAGAPAGTQLTPPRASDGKVKVSVEIPGSPPKVGYIDPSKVDGKTYKRI